MKTKSTTVRTLQVLTTVGATLYLLFIAMTIFYDSYPIFRPFDLPEALLVVFMVGVALAWMNKKKATGITFMIWNAVFWIWELYLSRSEQDYGMLSAMASSFMLVGSFFILEWYRASKTTAPSQLHQWRVMLRVLLLNYAVLYTIVVFSEVSVGEPVDYLRFPYLIYPLLFLIFWVGFLLSWKRELLAGYIFLIWCVILIIANIAYSEIRTLGGWALFGLPVMLQGIFYIKNHYQFRGNRDLDFKTH